MQGSFGGETFTFSLFLVLCNRLTTMTVAFTMLVVRCLPRLLPSNTRCPRGATPAAKRSPRLLPTSWVRGKLLRIPALIPCNPPPSTPNPAL